MGLKDALLNKVVFIDTAPLIYFIEGHSEHQGQLLEVFEENDKGKITLLTSTLTLLEVLVQPMKQKRLDLAEQYEQILTASPTIKIYDIDINIAKRAASIRAGYNLKTPDAIQIATAIENRATAYLTNDEQLKRVKELEVLTLD